jgi:serine/threonine protein kinase
VDPSLTIDPLLGSLIADRYSILNRLGEGGWGVVYRALDTKTNTDVALKVIRPDRVKHEAAVRRFLREMKATEKIDHPNTVRVLECGRDGGLSFLAMELLVGQSLGDMLGRPLPLDEALRMSLQILKGLQAAHDLRIVHRDLKPENIVIDDKRDVRVLDFGYARFEEPDQDFSGPLTATGVVMGSPMYISPEQINGDKADARSDLYSFGALLFTMVTGRAPFVAQKSPMEVLSQHTYDQPPTPSSVTDAEIPPWLDALILKLLRKPPQRRFQSAREVIAALEARGAVKAKARFPVMGFAAAVALGLVLSAILLSWML